MGPVALRLPPQGDGARSLLSLVHLDPMNTRTDLDRQFEVLGPWDRITSVLSISTIETIDLTGPESEFNLSKWRFHAALVEGRRLIGARRENPR